MSEPALPRAQPEDPALWLWGDLGRQSFSQGLGSCILQLCPPPAQQSSSASMAGQEILLSSAVTEGVGAMEI